MRVYFSILGICMLLGLISILALPCHEKIDKYELEYKSDGTVDLVPIYTTECK